MDAKELFEEGQAAVEIQRVFAGHREIKELIWELLQSPDGLPQWEEETL